jgi:hypothetical protein
MRDKNESYKLNELNPNHYTEIFLKFMKLAFLIFAHTAPNQLARLIKRLSSPNNILYVFVDKKADIDKFKAAITEIPSENVRWIKNRKSISWGDFTLVDAYLSAFEEILEQGPEPDYILTISGQDYPIATNEMINHWLARHRNQSIIEYTLVNEDAPHILHRLENYFLLVKRHHSIVYPHPNPNTPRRKLFNALLRLSGMFPLPRRRPLPEYYFGTNWMQLKPIAAKYLIDFARRNPAVVKYFRLVQSPDELFCQTVLLNAPESVRGEICNKRLTYMQWDRGENSYNIPISLDEIPAMLSSGRFFARKFDELQGYEIYDQIDQQLAQQ